MTIKLVLQGPDVDAVLGCVTQDEATAADIEVDRTFAQQGLVAGDPITAVATIAFITTTAIYAVVRLVVAEIEAGRQLEQLRLVGSLPLDLAKEVREAAKRHPSLLGLVPKEDPKP